MALVNVVKKVEKARDKLGLQPGEVVIAGCTTNPSGTMKKMLAKELGGVLGSAVASRGGGTDVEPENSMASQFPSGQHFLVLTNTRLFCTNVGAFSGNPKEIVQEWPRHAVVGLAADSGRMAVPLTLAFSDGTAVQVEGAKGSNPNSIVEAFDQAA
ncbi:MAG: hypothetical protein HKN94_07675 [Acidimicrobiales bacterium]|nr:hypothetical protein [Acidimicrobiales bacterium]RZV48005.1 MAG: hypothetical protein EX269_03405 [Acidimicrobiales bacterium]